MATSVALPDHLPPKLTISSWIWSWIVAATPGEPYDDLERCVAGLRERGFNAVRFEAGVNWAFGLDGKPRGAMGFRPWIKGTGWNFSSVNGRGGGRHDVLARLLQLFELAETYDIWLVPTSWEYQDSTSFVADPAIREEVYGVAPERRYMHLAERHDLLLRAVKERGLAHRIAYLEILNEPDCSDIPSDRAGKALHEEAIAWLHERHPEVMISADFTAHAYDLVPDNTQVFDQHVYAGARWYFQELYGETVRHPEFDPERPRALPILQRILREKLVPWDQFMVAAENIRESWRGVMWLYENLDNDRWDEWLAERFPIWRERMFARAAEWMAADAAEARRRGLPLVLDEGGFFFPPRLSRFELGPDGLSLLEHMADLAIAHGYWGFMPGTYCGPEHLLWQEKPGYLRQLNKRFLQSG